VNPRYLVDTDWAIDYLDGSPPIVSRLTALRPAGLAVSVITVAELLDGAYSSRDPTEEEAGIVDFLRGVEMLLVTEATGRIFAQQRSKLRKQGRAVGDLDLLIAATCLEHGLTLLTNNRRHFEMVDGLSIESI
jgi:tRNA(fMet)-specific endonuclease VapC